MWTEFLWLGRKDLGETGYGSEPSRHGQLGNPVYPELAEGAVQAYTSMKQQCLEQSVIHAGETLAQVLK